MYLDDILVTGSSPAAHLKNLEHVLTRLEDAGMRLKKGKCEFMLKEVEYLGHKISRDGLQPTDSSKIATVAEAPKPTGVAELRSFLGIVNYYGKFLPDLATTAAPLYNLLRKNTQWQWGKIQQSAFEKVKALLQSSDLLVHYDPEKEIILAADASLLGVGAVLSHLMEDGSERPIAYASRLLSVTECKYSQLDKEALAIVFAVKHFHQYVYGRLFTILSDHKSLMYIFDETKSVPLMAPARIQRWALTLGAYTYQIRYKSGRDNSNADSLSCLPPPYGPTEVPQPAETVLLMERLESSPISFTDIRNHTTKDPLLSKVRQIVTDGCPDVVDRPELQSFASVSHELSVVSDCLLRGNRMVVPTSLQEKVLDHLHDGHPGVVRMKSLARQYVWWPGNDKTLERYVQSRSSCQENCKSPQIAPLHPWEWPVKQWV